LQSRFHARKAAATERKKRPDAAAFESWAREREGKKVACRNKPQWENGENRKENLSMGKLVQHIPQTSLEAKTAPVGAVFALQIVT